MGITQRRSGLSGKPYGAFTQKLRQFHFGTIPTLPAPIVGGGGGGGGGGGIVSILCNRYYGPLPRALGGNGGIRGAAEVMGENGRDGQPGDVKIYEIASRGFRTIPPVRGQE